MFSEELKRVPLSISEIMTLTQIVDNERQRMRKLIKQHPDAKEDNEKRRAYIDELDDLTRALITNIG